MSLGYCSFCFSEVNSGFFYKSADERQKLVDAERKFTDDKVQKVIDLKRKVSCVKFYRLHNIICYCNWLQYLDLELFSIQRL